MTLKADSESVRIDSGRAQVEVYFGRACDVRTDNLSRRSLPP